ncbi:MAG: hypothetical protein R3F36_01460 [Candidatus Competibacteraceae bacterium]
MFDRHWGETQPQHDQGDGDGKLGLEVFLHLGQSLVRCKGNGFLMAFREVIFYLLFLKLLRAYEIKVIQIVSVSGGDLTDPW